MKKIFVDREDETPAVLQKMMNEPDPDIVLVVPRGAALKESLANFKLLKREAEGVQKNLAVESVDEDVLTVAKAVGIEAAHPLFRAARSGISDIVPVRRQPPPEPGRAERERVNYSEREATPSEPAVLRRAAPDETPTERPSIRARAFRPLVLVPAGALVLVGLGFVLTTQFLSTVEISLSFKKIPWSKTVSLSFSRALQKVTDAGIPAELFEVKRNVTQFFPASGSETVSEKAKGVVVIYNAYSSQPQLLVATTRFMTPDGKIFRITSQAQVPGAKVVDGKITPASIEAPVEADAPGPDYNRAGGERLSIPGFKGSPKYNGFYGVLTSDSGGFSGKRAVPTDKDIATAKEKTEGLLRQAVLSGFSAGRPSDFTVPDVATDVQITRLTVNRATDDKGNFSVFGEARLRAIGFREADVRFRIEALAGAEAPQDLPAPFRVQDVALRYENVKPDFGAGAMEAEVLANAVLTAAFSSDDFRTKVVGRDIQSVRSQIASLSGLVDANISVWPFWANSVSKIPSRVMIVVK